RLEQRAPDKEVTTEEMALGGRLADARLSCPDREQLALVVPVVESLVDVYALVALEADQSRAGGSRERLGDLCLANARFPFDQKRLLELGGEEHRGGKTPVSEVALARKRLAYLI